MYELKTKTIKTLEISNKMVVLYRDDIDLYLVNGDVIKNTKVIQVEDYGVMVLNENHHLGYSFHFLHEIKDIRFSKEVN